MPQTASRYAAATPASAAEGWTIGRLTPPSRLASANGLRTGKDGRIYVAQVAGSAVSAIDVDTGAIEAFSPAGGGIVGPDDLVFDDEGNLYCTEITENRVSMRAVNGTTRIVRGDIQVANPIAFHQNMLIAGELVIGGRIMELDRNGGEPRVIVEGVPMANAFDVGPDGKLYFPAQAANEIWRVDLAGGAPEVVAKDLGVPDSVKFAPDGSIISTQVYSGQVLKIDPRTGDRTVLADLTPGLDNVTFVGNRTFVSHINGSITEILSPGVVKPLVERGLQWPLGIAVDEGGTVFIADGGFTYTVAPGGEAELAGMLFSPGFPGWVRDAADAGGGAWVVTTANGDVARWNPAEQSHEMLCQGYERLMGVAVAPGGAVVFSEMPTGRVLSVEGGNVSVLATGLDTPMGVAVAGDGSVFVSEAGAGRVVKLAGGRSEIVLDGLGKPEGIAVHGGRLYVLDTAAKQVTECDLSGGNRRVIASDVPAGPPPGVTITPLGSVGDMCGPMDAFTGLAAGADGTLYISGSTEGSVLALRPA
jgi:sugar lactone lactonase YvrE